MVIEYSAATSCGKIRTENQDRLFADGKISPKNASEYSCCGVAVSEPSTFAVFDGMGGERCGAKAAELAVKSLAEEESSDETSRLTELCMTTNGTICEYMQTNRISAMGTTAAILRFYENGAEICNIGDSRIFLFDNGRAEQLSVDHTEIFGRMRPRRLLTQHLGIPEEEMMIEPYETRIETKKGEKFILCSDGLTDMVNENIIQKITQTCPIKEAGKALVDEALKNGGKDNVTVIACEVK